MASERTSYNLSFRGRGALSGLSSLALLLLCLSGSYCALLVGALPGACTRFGADSVPGASLTFLRLAALSFESDAAGEVPGRDAALELPLTHSIARVGQDLARPGERARQRGRARQRAQDGARDCRQRIVARAGHLFALQAANLPLAETFNEMLGVNLIADTLQRLQSSATEARVVFRTFETSWRVAGRQLDQFTTLQVLR